MPLDRLTGVLDAHVGELRRRGTAKGAEAVVTAVIPASGPRGPRFLLEGYGDKQFIRMNSNSYLGMGLRPEIIRAEEEAAQRFGAGPGAVRFISGTYAPHVELERRLAAFHGREAAMLFSSAYAAMVGTLVPLITDQTIVISDELNHNCIINGIRLARPLDKVVYPHLDMAALERALADAAGRARRVVVVTDGIFSMRGDHAPLDRIMELARAYDDRFEENVIVVVDDSHGVGAFGATGRGTEEYTGSPPADVLIATLGKALGVNGGYVASSASVIGYLRETSPFYIYSNPITPAEAAAALRALEILDSDEGRRLLDRLRALTRRFEAGLIELGFEVIPGEHPVVPLMIRDTERTRELVAYLREHGVLATGLSYPVVPRGDEEIRFQVSAEHTEADIDEVLGVLAAYQESRRQGGVTV
ncbi:MAG: aminotransferase class I/II-fold pyridoxal phosphate-dependent enzyme [bacterium]|jgi:glycine C-acetyltransferase|nr:MAG: 7-keto-8-aminopelargonate synthetase [bacterium]